MSSKPGVLDFLEVSNRLFTREDLDFMFDAIDDWEMMPGLLQMAQHVPIMSESYAKERLRIELSDRVKREEAVKEILEELSAFPSLIHEDFTNVWRLVAGRLLVLAVFSKNGTVAELSEVVFVNLSEKESISDSARRQGSGINNGQIGAAIGCLDHIKRAVFVEFEVRHTRKRHFRSITYVVVWIANNDFNSETPLNGFYRLFDNKAGSQLANLK